MTDRIRDVIAYDPHTGSMTWRAKLGPCLPGTPVKAVSVGIDGKRYQRSHLAWFLNYDELPAHPISPLDGDHANLRRDNWAPRTASTGRRGVYPTGSRFYAMRAGVRLGTRDTIEEAARLLQGD